jgi:hypothetical protein
MASYYLFVAHDGSTSTANHLRETKEGELLVAVNGERATYTHGGVEYSITVPSSGDYDDIASAVRAHRDRQTETYTPVVEKVDDVVVAVDNPETYVEPDYTDVHSLPSIQTMAVVPESPTDMAVRLAQQATRDCGNLRSDIVSYRDTSLQHYARYEELTLRVKRLEVTANEMGSTLSKVLSKLDAVDRSLGEVDAKMKNLDKLREATSILLQAVTQLAGQN